MPTENFELEVLKEGSIVSTIPLKGKAFFTLGRQHDLVDIPMDHMSISRMHAVLNFRDDGALMLRDLGSAQGTVLNKKPCEKDTYYRVYVGDLLKFGASTRKYIVNGPEEHRKPEYDSVNMEIYRDKLVNRSEEIKKKLEKEEEKHAFSWGMREDAEQPDEQVEQAEEELPDYLKKMKKDENFDRKYGDKFTANIGESEAKNSKDAEIMEKIRKKERKIQNMQEENRRIYLKEGAQEDGLTGGQAAAVARNDKSIASLTDEIAQLVGQIRAKATDRNGAAGDGANGSNKRAARENDDDDDVLDLSSQTADASTNWRLRKKLQKTVHLTAGSGGVAPGAGAETEQKSLSYAEIKQQLEEQTQLNAQLGEQIESTERFITTQESILANTTVARELQGDQIELVVAGDRIADSKASLKKLHNEQASVAMRVSRLQRLLQVATPALSSLVTKKTAVADTSKPVQAAIESAEQVQVVALSARPQFPSNTPQTSTDSALDQVPPAVAAQPMVMGPPSKNSKASLPVVDSTSDDASSGNAETDKLSSLVRFIEEEKAAEEAELKRKEQEAKAKSDAKLAQAAAAKSALSCGADTSSAVMKGPAPAPAPPAPRAPHVAPAVKGAARGPAPRPSDDSGRYDNSVLEGGEAAWVPPPKQTGDGKTALNAKYGY